MIRHHKYNAKRTTVDGITFASKAEAKRYGELRLMERAGIIQSLYLQPRYTLLDGMEGQRAIDYIADFEYVEDGKVIVEDVKGMPTPSFLMKKKMFHARYPELTLRIT